MSGLVLKPGTWLRLDGAAHELRDVDLAEQTVTIAGPDGIPNQVALDWLLNHPGLSDLAAPSAAAAVGDVLAVAPRHALSKAQARLEHVREVETGHKSGEPDDGAVPDPRYDPALVPSVIERRKAKAEELAQPAVDPRQRMSYRTLEREAAAWRESKPAELVDGRSCRRPTGSRLAADVLDAIEAVVEQRRHESNFQTLDGLAFLVRARVMKQFPDTHEDLLPQGKYGNKTIIRAAQQMYTRGELIKGKAKYRATKPPTSDKPAGRLLCTRPGQILMGDTKDLDVLLRITVFEGAVRGKLVWFMDVYSHSIPEVRVVELSEKAVDVGHRHRLTQATGLTDADVDAMLLSAWDGHLVTTPQDTGTAVNGAGRYWAWEARTRACPTAVVAHRLVVRVHHPRSAAGRHMRRLRHPLRRRERQRPAAQRRGTRPSRSLPNLLAAADTRRRRARRRPGGPGRPAAPRRAAGDAGRHRRPQAVEPWLRRRPGAVPARHPAARCRDRRGAHRPGPRPAAEPLGDAGRARRSDRPEHRARLVGGGRAHRLARPEHPPGDCSAKRGGHHRGHARPRAAPPRRRRRARPGRRRRPTPRAAAAQPGPLDLPRLRRLAVAPA
jgi:hypothetical protein